MQNKALPFISASLIAVLLISNLTSTKLVDVFGLTLDGGTFLFPIAYIFGDILTEVYGYRASRVVIWTGFFWLLVASLIFQIVASMPYPVDYTLQDSFYSIFSQTPRIVVASLLAYWMGEFVNAAIMSRMKILTSGKHLWARTIGSTIAGQGVDTVFFIFIAFAGVFSTELLIAIALSNYVFKVGVEIAFTPLTYVTVSALKRFEGIDVYDKEVSLNPFMFRL